jgi:hypothetical protein
MLLGRLERGSRQGRAVRGEHVKDQATAGGGGVEVLMQRGEPDLGLAQITDHSDQILQGA